MQEIHPVLNTAALGKGELVHKSAEIKLGPMWESPRGNCCSQYRYRGVSQWNLDFVVSFLARKFRFQKGSFREQNGCWNEKPELLRECCGMCQRPGRRHRTEGTIPRLSLDPHFGVIWLQSLWSTSGSCSVSLYYCLLSQPLHYWTNY